MTRKFLFFAVIPALLPSLVAARPTPPKVTPAAAMATPTSTPVAGALPHLGHQDVVILNDDEPKLPVQPRPTITRESSMDEIDREVTADDKVPGHVSPIFSEDEEKEESEKKEEEKEEAPHSPQPSTQGNDSEEDFDSDDSWLPLVRQNAEDNRDDESMARFLARMNPKKPSKKEE